MRGVLGHIGISTPSGNALHKFLQNHDEGEIKCRFAKWREVTKICIHTKYKLVPSAISDWAFGKIILKNTSWVTRIQAFYD